MCFGCFKRKAISSWYVEENRNVRSVTDHEDCIEARTAVPCVRKEQYEETASITSTQVTVPL